MKIVSISKATILIFHPILIEHNLVPCQYFLLKATNFQFAAPGLEFVNSKAESDPSVYAFPYRLVTDLYVSMLVFLLSHLEFRPNLLLIVLIDLFFLSLELNLFFPFQAISINYLLPPIFYIFPIIHCLTISSNLLLIATNNSFFPPVLHLYFYSNSQTYKNLQFQL